MSNPAAGLAQLAAFIRDNLPLVPIRGVPELRLHRAGPASRLSRLAAGNPSPLSPYWAYDWGGGLALARYILDNPETVAGRTVLDLGTGSGLVAIAAAKAGARSVTAVDIDPAAIAASELNAAANGVAISTILSDMLDDPPPDVQIILVGDLFYDAGLAARVVTFLDHCQAAGIEILIGDPHRATLPLHRLRKLADLTVQDYGSAPGTPSPGAVFAFLGA